MFAVNRYIPDDTEEASSKTTGLNNVLERAKMRQKRKRQEETFSARAEIPKISKENSKNKAKLSPVTPARVETLDERNARKAAAKAIRRSDKQINGFDNEVSDSKMTESELSTVNGILATQLTGNANKTKKSRPLENIAKPHQDIVFNDASDVLAVQEDLAHGNQSLNRMSSEIDTSKSAGGVPDDEVDEANSSELSRRHSESGILNSVQRVKAQPAGFVEQLTRASKDALPRARRIDDEDDEAMDTMEPLAPAPPPVSVEESMKLWGVSAQLTSNLIAMGIQAFFPVQRSVIPAVIHAHKLPFMQPRDLCVSAPTGSGKTIAYTLPILQTLLGREVIRLRALILLPSRDLAVQVHSVLKAMSKDTGLEVALVTGQNSFEDEQSMLVGNVYQESRNPRSMSSEFSFAADMSNARWWKHSPEPEGHSLVDILVCTPGRLLDHLEYTAGFTLQHVRFLVLDEADRLLSNAYHGWIKSLVQGVQTVRSSPAAMSDIELRKSKDHSVKGFLYQSNAAPLQRLLFSATLTDNPRKLAMLNIRNPDIIRARAAEGSAGDVGATAIDGLDISEEPTSGYVLPSTLSESVLTCDAVRRPQLLVTILLEAFARVHMLPAIEDSSTYDDDTENLSHARHKGHIICKNAGDVVLIFASSVDTVHRLGRLLQLINGQNDDDHKEDLKSDSVQNENNSTNLLFGGSVVELNRMVKADERALVLRQAAEGKISVLVASDSMARGIDLPNIKLVVNYDPPKFARSYVHRVGRTARANRDGHSVTLVKEGQLGAFKKMRAQISNQNVLHSAILSVPTLGGESFRSDGSLNKCKPSKSVEARVKVLVAAALKRLPAFLQEEL